jgi:AraC-like DNA-binding protein
MAENTKKLITLPYDDNKRESVFCSERYLEKDYAMHSHNFFEIEFLIEGEGVQVINGKAHPWQAGGICFFSPTDFHEIRTDGALRFYNISFDIESLSKETVGRIIDLGANTFLATGTSRAHLEMLAKMLAERTKAPSDFDKDYAVLLLNAFLSQLHYIADCPERMNTQLIVLKQAALFMHANFSRKLTLAEIASAVHLSATYLSDLFSKEMGITVFRYLSELRIDYAKKLLDSTSDAVTEVCFACGYTSIPNFMKDFKRIVGTSALKYRTREGAEKKSTTESDGVMSLTDEQAPR